MKAKYINPFTDFGFKKIFGEEVNKDLLMDFLNQILPEKHRIKELFYKKPKIMEAYENSLKYYRDLKNVIDTANIEGIQKGIEQGRNEKTIEIALNAIEKGLSDELIIALTGLSAEQIQQLRENKNIN